MKDQALDRALAQNGSFASLLRWWNSTRRVIVAGGCAVLSGCGGGGGGSDVLSQVPEQGPVALKSCEQLKGMVISPSSIGLPTRGATILSATREAPVAPYADAEGEHLITTPARCVFQGTIASVDGVAPVIQ